MAGRHPGIRSNSGRTTLVEQRNWKRCARLGYNAGRTGLLAWWRGQPGQVGNEAATAVFHQCRGSGSSPFFLLFLSSREVLRENPTK
ncbi:hypothetical protein D9X30_5290 [Cupriavidus sp. U2]|nr:hypothetical protein D9X30_5290 [Cupriavidus sp. U2]